MTSLQLIAIVDTGPLLAAADRDDQHHARCEAFFRQTDAGLVIPALVVGEVSYLLGTRLGATAEARFLRALQDWEVETPATADWDAIADLVERYADFPLGATDASVAVLADNLSTDLIVTLDRRHFGALRMPSGRTFTMLPD